MRRVEVGGTVTQHPLQLLPAMPRHADITSHQHASRQADAPHSVSCLASRAAAAATGAPVPSWVSPSAPAPSDRTACVCGGTALQADTDRGLTCVAASPVSIEACA